ncbi:MAG: hypothetical protein RRY36_05240 [Bacteroidaceae bacterium]
MKKIENIKEEEKKLLEAKYTVRHGIAPVKMNAMILPVGFPLNYSLAYDSKIGDTIKMYDDVIVSIVDKLIIPAKCDYADILCKLVYGYSANVVVNIMKKIEIEEENHFSELVLIIYKHEDNSANRCLDTEKCNRAELAIK